MSMCPSCAASPGRPFGTQDGFSLFTCEVCELTYVDPMPTTDELAEFYREYYKTRQYRQKLESKVRRARRRIRRLKWGRAGARFIDVGCNVGFAVEAARQCGLQGMGIDIDAVAIREARTLFPDCRFEPSSAEDIASTGQRFDIVYCSEVIEHLPNVVSFLQALQKLVAEDGLVFINNGIKFDDLKEILYQRELFRYNRESHESDLMKTMGSFSPAFGMVGTLIGLVFMLFNMGGSGGIDSIVLLDILNQIKAKYSFEIVLIHINYGMQKESDNAEKLCFSLSSKYQFEIISKKVTLNNSNFESNAREIRYNFFNRDITSINFSFFGCVVQW